MKNKHSPVASGLRPEPSAHSADTTPRRMDPELYQPGDHVTHAVHGPGIVREHSVFADHYEHLIEWPDGTASWIHEEQLAPDMTRTTHHATQD